MCNDRILVGGRRLEKMGIDDFQDVKERATVFFNLLKYYIG